MGFLGIISTTNTHYLGRIFVGMVPWRGPTLGSGKYIQPSLPASPLCHERLARLLRGNHESRQITQATNGSWNMDFFLGVRWCFAWKSGFFVINALEVWYILICNVHAFLCLYFTFLIYVYIHLSENAKYKHLLNLIFSLLICKPQYFSYTWRISKPPSHHLGY